jgi:hypothetical protein
VSDFPLIYDGNDPLSRLRMTKSEAGKLQCGFLPIYAFSRRLMSAGYARDTIVRCSWVKGKSGRAAIVELTDGTRRVVEKTPDGWRIGRG